MHLKIVLRLISALYSTYILAYSYLYNIYILLLNGIVSSLYQY